MNIKRSLGAWFVRCMGLALIALSWSCSSTPSRSSHSDKVGSQSEAITLPSGFIEEEVGTGWDNAVGITFSSSGRMFVWEKAGKVWEVQADGTRAAQPLIDLSQEVGNWRDYGMLGFALHPNFENNGYIYVLYVVDYYHLKNFGTASYDPQADEYFVDTIGRVARYQARASDNFTTVDPASRKVLLGESIDQGFPILHESHGVGSLVFGDDGSLLVSCGDGASYNRVDSGVVTERPATGLADGIIRPQEDVGAFRSQLIDSLSGKVVRLDAATGDGVVGNPFFDAQNPRSARSRVWALGLRNPFRMSLRPESGDHDPSEGKPGTLYIGDVGWTDWEELNVARAPARNFGWPLFEGQLAQPGYVAADPANRFAANPLNGTTPAGQPPCNKPYFIFEDLLKQDSQNSVAFPNPCAPAQAVPAAIPTFLHTRPALTWPHNGGQALVPTYDGAGNATTAQLGSPGAPPGSLNSGSCSTGGVWYTGSDFPPEYANTFFLSDYVGGWIKNLVFDANDKLVEVRNFAPGSAPVVGMATHPTQGGLYYVSYGGNVRRIRYVGGGNRPPIAVASADVGSGPSPLVVHLTGSASRDPELGALTYAWNFGDGSPIGTTADMTHTFGSLASAAQSFLVRLTVTDVQGLTATTTFPIFVNDTAPQVSITQPAADTFFSTVAPAPLQLVAVPQDAEEPAAGLACSWQVIFHHNTHTHVEAPASGCTQAVHVSSVACDDETYYYEFKVTVTDSVGMTTTKSTWLYPDCLPRLVSPTGATSSNAFRWKPVNGADSYTLWVDDASGSGVVNAVVTAAEAGCSDQISDCVFSPLHTFAGGPAAFRVRAHSPGSGWRGWSAFQSFQMLAGSCFDGIQNQGETAVDCDGPCTPCALTCKQDPLTVSSAVASTEEAGVVAANFAIDGDVNTRWASLIADPQWLMLDLGAAKHVTKLTLQWETAASSNYDIQVATSPAGPWTNAFHQGAGAGGTEDITGLNVNTRYLRIYSNTRLTQYGVSLWEVGVFGDNNALCGATCGNGSVGTGEECDDGNSIDNDACSNSCKQATCSDAVQNHGETGVDCGGPCAQLCLVCGNGIVQAGEACDDGNAVNNDTCSNSCVRATCTDGAQNQGEVGTDCGGPCPACAATCAQARLAPVSAAASTEEGGLVVASYAIDNNLGTRWSSLGSDPQWLRLDMGATRRIKKLVLRWEVAASANYDIQVADSPNGPWTQIYHQGNGAGNVETITGLNASARYLRMYSNARLTGYGVSLWELEVYGDNNPTCGSTCGNGVLDAGEQCDDGNAVGNDSCSNACVSATCSDGALNHGETGVDCGGPCAQQCVVCGNGVVQSGEACDDGNAINNDTCSNACVLATCSDQQQNQGEVGVDCGGPCAACAPTCSSAKLTPAGAVASTEEAAVVAATYAVDGSINTRWASVIADPQWLRVDMGAARRIKRVVLRWETAASSNYDIQVSDNASGPWTTIFHDGAGVGGTKDITGLNASGRYVRLYSNSRATQYGVSLWEMEVYGDLNPTCGSTCGNGAIDSGEQCDDGNATNTDNCNNLCQLNTCTDGVANHGETGVDCGGPCAQQCVVCGDGVKQAAEQCDDGNLTNNDSCSNSCILATCADGAQNHGEIGVDCGGPCAACALTCADNKLAVAEVSASSQEGGQTLPSFATDGLPGTRWASTYADPQWLKLDLGGARRIKHIVLNWEFAASKNYDIQTADSASGPWTTIYHQSNGAGGVEQITGLNASARYVRLYSNTRLTQYGVSLWELEVYGDVNASCGNPCGNGVLEPGEQCDDGNSVDDDSCSRTCVSATCTDGSRNQGEAGVDCGGPCGQVCMVCGNGVLQTGEACDDGNTVDNDFCSNQCVIATCSDTRQNHGETGVDCGGPCGACALVCADLPLPRVGVSASSEEAAVVSAAKAIDGDPSTRWASSYSDLEWIKVDLGAQRRIRRVIASWELASSKVYDLQVADNAAGPWTTVFHDSAGTGGVKTITGLNANGRYVRLYSTKRNTIYGISLFELEVYGDLSSACGP